MAVAAAIFSNWRRVIFTKTILLQNSAPGTAGSSGAFGLSRDARCRNVGPSGRRTGFAAVHLSVTTARFHGAPMAFAPGFAAVQLDKGNPLRAATVKE